MSRVEAGRAAERDDVRSRRHALLSVGRAILIVLLVGGVVRAVATATLSLIITNDGTDYLWFAEQILGGSWQPARPDRTPGYPAILAGCLGLFGLSPVALLALQHALGLGAALLLTWALARKANPVCGLFAGLCAALDPWLLSFESYVLSETPATLAMAAIAAVVLLPVRRAWLRAVALGFILAAACLVRPTFQIVAPFAAVGLALSAAARLLPRVALVAVSAAACVIGLTPWLLVQHHYHGRAALSFGTGAHLFSGVARLGLLDEHVLASVEIRDAPSSVAPVSDRRSVVLPTEIRDAYAPCAGRPMGDGEFWAFCWKVGGLERNERALRDWAVASIWAAPQRYAGGVLQAIGWQLNYPLPGSTMNWDELGETVARLVREGDGRQYEPGPPSATLDGLNHQTRGGPLRPVLKRVADGAPRGVPQIALAGCSAAALLWAARRRDGAVACLLLGSAAFVGMHALFLFPNPRYALPAWIVWYFVPPLMGYWLSRRPSRKVAGIGSAGSARK